MMSLIVNPTAGDGRCRGSLAEVLGALRRHGLDYRVQQCRDLEHARALAREAAAGDEVAVAFGGDGLAAAVAAGLCGHGGVLGVIPGGRGNDFARSLSLPTDPVAACAALAGGHTLALDLGVCAGANEERTFLGIATCGFDSEANRIANATTLPLGKLVYAYGALRALASWRPLQFSLRLDGRPLELSGYTVAVANAPYHGGGMRVAPQARLDDGLLDVVMIGEVSKPAFVAQLPRVFRGTHLRGARVSIVRAAEVEIRASRPTVMYADGEPLTALPVRLRVRPGALRVLVGR